TEVVLRAYLQWGEEFAEHVHGMFAVAIWDSRRRKLVLARDRLGKKPLYYALRGSRLIFASELKALVAHGGVARELDPEALVPYLACEYVPAPGTILRPVRKLPAAHGAQLAGSRPGTEHVSQKFSGQDCLDLIPAAAAQPDEALGDPSFLPTPPLSRLTRRHVTVALAGDGGDELFAGYDPFLAHRP